MSFQPLIELFTKRSLAIFIMMITVIIVIIGIIIVIITSCWPGGHRPSSGWWDLCLIKVPMSNWFEQGEDKAKMRILKMWKITCCQESERSHCSPRILSNTWSGLNRWFYQLLLPKLLWLGLGSPRRPLENLPEWFNSVNSVNTFHTVRKCIQLLFPNYEFI